LELEESYQNGDEMKTYTMGDIIRECPCDRYSIDRLDELADGRNQITPLEISELDIPILDKLWILSRLLYRTSPHAANRITRMIALNVVNYWDCPDLCFWYLSTGDNRIKGAWIEADIAVDAAQTRDEGLAARAARAADISLPVEAVQDVSMCAAPIKIGSMEKYITWIVSAWEVRP
jgi:hypothetical protein